MRITGWERIIPQLTAFFVVLTRRDQNFAPLNLFLHGAPGTNKTEGILELARFLEYSARLIDTSTLDDVSELLGVVDINANRQRGEARVIEGDLLKAQIVVLDEFLNARGHVLPQFRLLLQGYMVMLAKQMPISALCFIGTGNLDADIEEGQANLLDSPTADRFAMIVSVPSLVEMPDKHVMSILDDECDGSFAQSFRQAFDGAEAHFDAVSRAYNDKVNRYVLLLVKQLHDTEFVLEGRRAKLLKQFVLAALALCRAEPERDASETIWAVTRDCLTYHRLSGVDLDMAKLQNAHDSAFTATMADSAVEALIATESDLSAKIALVTQHLNEVSPITKADVFGMAVTSPDLPLKLALVDLVRSPVFANEPAELRAMIERIDFAALVDDFVPSAAQLGEFSRLSQTQVLTFVLARGDQERMRSINGEVSQHLSRWKLPPAHSNAA